ncbi:MAG: SocA family protein [Crenarchaeota archaeon]|nr:SocA family protein [Thermoproteota archaeon]
MTCLTEIVLSGIYKCEVMSRTKLFQYLLLIDYVAQVEIGRPLTGLKWKKYHYSIYPDNRHDVQNVLDELINDTGILKQEGQNYRLVKREEAEKIYNKLNEKVRKVIDKVVELVKQKSERELLELIIGLRGIKEVPCMHPINLEMAEPLKL